MDFDPADGAVDEREKEAWANLKRAVAALNQVDATTPRTDTFAALRILGRQLRILAEWHPEVIQQFEEYLHARLRRRRHGEDR